MLGVLGRYILYLAGQEKRLFFGRILTKTGIHCKLPLLSFVSSLPY